jgi:hypothetical protein
LRQLKAGEPRVKVRELLQRWSETRARSLTAEEYPLKLDVDDAAKLHALAEMYPGVPVDEILRDLVSAALFELEEAMPYVQGSKVVATDDHGDPVYDDAGPTPRFIELSRKHRERIGNT